MTDTHIPAAVTRRHPVPPGEFTFEPSARLVRGTIGEHTVVESTAPVLVWEPDQAVPGYVFPRADVRTELLTPTEAPAHDRHAGVRTWYDLELDGVTYPALAFDYAVEGLEDYVGIDWFRRTDPGVEHWYEEAEEIFRHPRDPYKRIDSLQSTRHVEVYIGDTKVADTRVPVLLFETRLPVRYYIRQEDVDFTHLRETTLSTTCPYKGDARYWSYENGEAVLENVIWAYPTPLESVSNITDYVSFYNEVVDIVVDGIPLTRPVSEFSGRLATRPRA
ncbi:DUF427 domain-containing protein [Rhodococcus globerulus]|uniref:DUF427 domain-containing protein n=1 Tax=Rhodococcus globerulus TaxID=33008 RepID=A0ABU4C554_RHOGO|nr:DUF427 domain-containing protein [Rhodococcus globerulus]MDV6271645.1 DUF427 domain-containing protein [Rhodococcus globerulus]